MIRPPLRMLATGVADLDQQVLDWMGRAPLGFARYFGEDDGVNAEGQPVILCIFVEVGGTHCVEVCRAASTVSWVDAVRNCLGIALTLEPANLDVALGLASLEALKALALIKQGRK